MTDLETAARVAARLEREAWALEANGHAMTASARAAEAAAIRAILTLAKEGVKARAEKEKASKLASEGRCAAGVMISGRICPECGARSKEYCAGEPHDR